jgi:RHH-type proline utilization regulon transcriptional repressor/proline dehydrogenase/delta 1-pyrroline-5-carboxylate dehydrogenase
VLALMHIEDGESRDVTTDSSSQHPQLDCLAAWLDEAIEENQIEAGVGHDVAGAIRSGRQAMETEFSREHDTIRLVGEDNIRRYRPVRALTIRVTAVDSLRDAMISIAAAVAVRAQVTLSIDPTAEPLVKTLLESTADAVPGLIHPIEETEPELIDRIAQQNVARLRLLDRTHIASPLAIACGDEFVTIVDEPVLAEGRIECLRYLDEQSISESYHRYGNLGRRAGEDRRDVL